VSLAQMADLHPLVRLQKMFVDFVMMKIVTIARTGVFMDVKDAKLATIEPMGSVLPVANVNPHPLVLLLFPNALIVRTPIAFLVTAKAKECAQDAKTAIILQMTRLASFVTLKTAKLVAVTDSALHARAAII